MSIPAETAIDSRPSISASTAVGIDLPPNIVAPVPVGGCGKWP
jgi:hypothetical protein